MLIILATHPIQYYAPAWRELARRENIKFEVWYLSSHGVSPTLDKEFNKTFKWDLNLVEGYPNRFSNYDIPKITPGFWKIGLPKDYIKRLKTDSTISTIYIPGWGIKACWEAVHIAKKIGIKTALRGDSTDLQYRGPLKRVFKKIALNYFFAMIDIFLYVGLANKRLYESYGILESKLISGLHSVDNNRFQSQYKFNIINRNQIRRDWNISDNSICILFVGKFINQKRPNDIIEAVKSLRNSGDRNNYHLLFVGSGYLGSTLKRNCSVVFDAEFPIDNLDNANKNYPKASFSGFMNQHEITKAYVAADMLILPSESETWGLVVNEAYASELPCIVSDACGCAEDLVAPLDQKLCYMHGNVDALANAIKHLSQTPPSKKIMRDLVEKYSYLSLIESLENFEIKSNREI